VIADNESKADMLRKFIAQFLVHLVFEETFADVALLEGLEPGCPQYLFGIQSELECTAENRQFSVDRGIGGPR
jgi:hypothetical protein